MPNTQKPKSKQIDAEAMKNLSGFFEVLLKIDKRNNPQNYEDNGGSDSADQA